MSASPELEPLLDPANRADPYPVLSRLRSISPYLPMPGLALVARHADCAQVLRDPGMSSDRTRSRLTPEAARGPRTRNFLHLDPPDHTRFRRLVTKAFTPRVVTRLEPRIQQITDELFAGIADRGVMEVVADLAYPLPLRVICELLGVPGPDHQMLQNWSAKLSEALEPPIPGLVDVRASADAARARAEFIGYFRDLIAERRRAPRDDLVSYLAHVADGPDRLSTADVLATCVLLINAGHETTVNLIANGVLALLRHPAQLAALRREPALAAGAVEEVLRYDAPVQMTSRVARHDVRLGAVDVHRDDTVLVLLGAANRDPDAFPEPDRFDFRRSARAQHLAFSAGPHFCLGASLARLEGRIAFEAFATRLIEPRLHADPVRYKPNLSLRGPDLVTVDFTAVMAVV